MAQVDQALLKGEDRERNTEQRRAGLAYGVQQSGDFDALPQVDDAQARAPWKQRQHQGGQFMRFTWSAAGNDQRTSRRGGRAMQEVREQATKESARKVFDGYRNQSFFP